MSKMIPVRTEMLENILWQQMKKIYPSQNNKYQQNQKIQKKHLDIECCTSATQDCEVCIELETASIETVPITEDLMQIQIFKDSKDFETKDLQF